ncbi:hypothetical protein PENTCL1PPCAC_3688, partial [Pristionchus entomophagus]
LCEMSAKFLFVLLLFLFATAQVEAASTFVPFCNNLCPIVVTNSARNDCCRRYGYPNGMAFGVCLNGRAFCNS